MALYITDENGVPHKVASGGNDVSNPMTTAGDLIVGGLSGSPTRLGIGSAGQVLKVNSSGTGLEYGAGSPYELAASIKLTSNQKRIVFENIDLANYDYQIYYVSKVHTGTSETNVLAQLLKNDTIVTGVISTGHGVKVKSDGTTENTKNGFWNTDNIYLYWVDTRKTVSLSGDFIISSTIDDIFGSNSVKEKDSSQFEFLECAFYAPNDPSINRFSIQCQNQYAYFTTNSEFRLYRRLKNV